MLVQKGELLKFYRNFFFKWNLILDETCNPKVELEFYKVHFAQLLEEKSNCNF